MYERFTDRARRVMSLANAEACSANFKFITTEHLLLGLLQEDQCVAVNVLKNLEIDPNELYLEIQKLLPSRPYRMRRDNLPQSPHVKAVLVRTIEEADLLDHKYVGTEHLLLGLVSQKECVAAQALINLGLKLEEVREEVLRVLGRQIPEEKPSSVPPRPKPAPPSAESERIQALERQLWNVRVVLGAVVGAMAGVLLAAATGAVLGLILGGGVAAFGRRILAILAGGITGVMLGSAHLTAEGGGLAGALLGALAGFLIAEIGGPSSRGGQLIKRGCP